MEPPWKRVDTLVVLAIIVLAVVGSITVYRLETQTHQYTECVQAHENDPVAADTLCAPLLAR